MDTRSIETILTDWRAAERELETALEDAKAAIQARIYQLHEEYQAAVADREAIAEDLRQPA
jgi:hypothetical protein